MAKRRTTTMLAAGLLLACSVAPASAEVVVVASARSALESLTPQQLADVYLGRRSRLPNGRPVKPINQSERSPAYEAFYAEYLERSPAQVKAHWSRLVFTGHGRPPRAASNGAKLAQIGANDANALGYVHREHVDERLRIVSIEPR